MRYRSLALAAVGLLAVAGCATNPDADQAAYAQRALIGMPKQTLLSCAGVPTRQTAVDNVEYFTYSSDSLQTRVGPSYWGGFGGGPWHRGYWGGADFGPTEVSARNCNATFTLKNGAVQQLVYGSSTDSPAGRLSQCYAIVQNCLPLVPQQPGPAASAATGAGSRAR
ncbi:MULTISPECIES: hypothetical protein [Nitrospirillum]|uniref:DUF4136 domain-containing protein n=1 Tax=Nitrospirillum amazonense TaxID=28077 RepID=A0A560FRF2_9PROT|nr:hypothetical protein [Nitrospirillum amazonense]MEC4595143.1 hypothetical protein [Nitrospirillum amazonense]TWB24161.1 hypothetical protein FBZ88_11213 [Nitrospirillum amazonense]